MITHAPNFPNQQLWDLVQKIVFGTYLHSKNNKSVLTCLKVVDFLRFLSYLHCRSLLYWMFLSWRLLCCSFLDNLVKNFWENFRQLEFSFLQVSLVPNLDQTHFHVCMSNWLKQVFLFLVHVKFAFTINWFCLKVSKFQKQIFLFSFEPKTERNYFLMSALRI